MANVESYPISAIFAGDIYCPIGATTVEVIGLQTIPIAPNPLEDEAVPTYVSENSDIEWLVPIFNRDNTFFVSLVAGDVLVYNGFDWTNAPLPSIATGGYFDIDDGTFLIPQSSFTFDDSTF